MIITSIWCSPGEGNRRQNTSLPFPSDIEIAYITTGTHLHVKLQFSDQDSPTLFFYCILHLSNSRLLGSQVQGLMIAKDEASSERVTFERFSPLHLVSNTPKGTVQAKAHLKYDILSDDCTLQVAASLPVEAYLPVRS